MTPPYHQEDPDPYLPDFDVEGAKKLARDLIKLIDPISPRPMTMPVDFENFCVKALESIHVTYWSAIRKYGKAN